MPKQLHAETSVGFEQLLAKAIAHRITEQRFNLWFRDHTKFVHLGETVVIGVPNLYFHDWLQKTFGDDVRAAVAEILGQSVAVRFAIDPELFQAQRQEESAKIEEPVEGEQPSKPKKKQAATLRRRLL